MAAGGSLSRAERKAAARAEILQQEEQRDRRRQVSRILKRPAGERTPEENLLVGQCEDIARELERRRKKREGLRRRQEEYPHLWCMSKPPSRRPKLYIVNLQWTPKDDLAALKLHGKCDDVMRLLMEELGLEIPCYDRTKDPIFSLAIPLSPDEEGSHSRRPLAPPWSLEEVQIQEQQREPASQLSLALPGGWFGRGCTKGSKKKK